MTEPVMVPLTAHLIKGIHGLMSDIADRVLEATRPLWKDELGRYGFSSSPDMFFFQRQPEGATFVTFSWDDLDNEYGGGGFEWTVNLEQVIWYLDPTDNVEVSYDQLIEQVEQDVEDEVAARAEAKADKIRKSEQTEEARERAILAQLTEKYGAPK